MTDTPPPDRPPKRARSAIVAAAGPRPPRLTDRVEVAALAAVAGTLGLLGVDRASALMGWLWRRLAPLNKRHARAAAHLATALPALTPAERAAVLGDMWENLGRTAAESFLLPRLVADRERFDLDAPSIGAATEGQGAIFASLHMGNWELAGWGIRLSGRPVAAVYRPLNNPLADAFLKTLREPIYDGGLMPREASTALRLRTLARRGVSIGMVADQRDATGIEVPFFGRPALANTLPVVLARRLGLPLIAGRVVRTRGARFRVEAVPVPYPVTEDVDADVRVGTEALTRQFEDWIRQTPGQWMWAHRKWREAP